MNTKHGSEETHDETHWRKPHSFSSETALIPARPIGGARIALQTCSACIALPLATIGTTTTVMQSYQTNKQETIYLAIWELNFMLVTPMQSHAGGIKPLSTVGTSASVCSWVREGIITASAEEPLAAPER